MTAVMSDPFAWADAIAHWDAILPDMTLAFPDPQEISDRTLTLRPWTPADVTAIRTIANDPLIAQWNPFPAALEQWLERRAIWDDHASWAVIDERGVLVGSVSLFQFEPASNNCQLGYWTAPTARGRGIAVDAVRCAATFAFATLGIERIAVFHAVENEASCRVAQKAGFVLEGVTRQSWRYADGALHDEHLHARLRTDQ